MLANFSNLITFSRGSNATVTDASGRLTYAPHNLVTNSQDFEAAAWNGAGLAAKTANIIAAPDGTITGDRLVINNSSIQHRVDFTPSSPVGFQIFSVYLKQDTYRWVSLRIGSVGATFDLQNGVVGTTNTATSRGMTAAGNGWYRCFILVSAAANDVCRINVENADAIGTSFVGDNTTGVYLWGAQLEAVTYQTTPSPYVSTSVANLLGFSEDFTNAAWAKSNTAIVPGAAQNPINNLWNAQKLMEDTATAGHFVNQLVTTVAGVSYTASVYLKAAGRNARLFVYQSASPFTTIGSVTVDLSNGAVLSGAGSVTSVGNGWYRVSVTGAAIDTATRVRVDLAQGVTFSYAGDGNSGIYIYGAQLSNSGSLDPYVPTPGAAPSSTAYYGPRFDYDPVTLAAKGILIEEQRTNLLTYSNTFSNAAWAWASGATGTLSQNVLSPDGSVNAWTIADTDNAAAQLIQQSATLTAVTHTFSCYFKKTTGAQSTYPVLLVVNGGNLNGAVCTVDTTNGVATVWTAFTGWTIVTSTATCTDAGAYWRVSLTFLGQSAGFLMRIAPAGTSNPTQSTGTLATNLTGSTVIYGAQLEAGAFATSYIPTVASQVTRSADLASITGSLFSQWYRQDEGTFVYAYQRLLGYTGGRIFASGVGGSNSYGIWVNTATGTQDALTVRDISGDAVSGVLFSVNTTAINKAAVTYKVNDFAWSTNGGAAATDTSGVVPSLSDQLRIGRAINTDGANLNGHIQNITYYPTRLTNDQLQAITK